MGTRIRPVSLREGSVTGGDQILNRLEARRHR
jgi:hypothetical protein